MLTGKSIHRLCEEEEQNMQLNHHTRKTLETSNFSTKQDANLIDLDWIQCWKQFEYLMNCIRISWIRFGCLQRSGSRMEDGRIRWSVETSNPKSNKRWNRTLQTSRTGLTNVFTVFFKDNNFHHFFNNLQTLGIRIRVSTQIQFLKKILLTSQIKFTQLTNLSNLQSGCLALAQFSPLYNFVFFVRWTRTHWMMHAEKFCVKLNFCCRKIEKNVSKKDENNILRKAGDLRFGRLIE